MGTGPYLEGFQFGHFSVFKKWYFSVISSPLPPTHSLRGTISFYLKKFFTCRGKRRFPLYTVSQGVCVASG